MNELLIYANESPWKFGFTMIIIAFILREIIGFFLKTGDIADKLETIISLLDNLNKKK